MGTLGHGSKRITAVEYAGNHIHLCGGDGFGVGLYQGSLLSAY